MSVWNSGAGERTTHCCPREPGTSLTFTVASQLLQALNFIGEDGVAALLF